MHVAQYGCNTPYTIISIIFVMPSGCNLNHGIDLRHPAVSVMAGVVFFVRKPLLTELALDRLVHY